MSRMIAIASGKGGVGKTWLTVSLAQGLARLGRQVLVFDADLGLANVDIQLGLEPDRDLGTVLAGRCRLDEAARPYPPGGFDLIAGRSGSGRLALLGRERLAALLAELGRLAGGYDDVLLDLPAGIDETVRTLLDAVGLRLVVTTDEPTALTDAYALMKVARREGTDAGFMIAVNFAPDHATGEQTYRALRRVCERFLGTAPPLAGVLRRDPRVPEAIRQQAPFLSRHPLGPAAADVEAMARGLARP